MLCQFSFQNFKSYRDETVFDLQATAIPEFKDNLIVKDKCSDLLPVSVIYGPNGGGKTNLIRALSCLITTVVRPIHDLGSTRKMGSVDGTGFEKMKYQQKHWIGKQ